MHIDSLKLFHEVATVRSISKVAKSSLISQSALSQQIQKLEDSLGYKLFERSNKGVELTEAGCIVEKYAKNVLKNYESMMEELNNMSDSNSIIKINSICTIATYALPCALFKIKKKYPIHKYSLTSNLSDDVEQYLIGDNCDIGFIYGKPSDDTLVSHKTGVDKFIWVASQDFNISQNIYVKNLVGYGLIMLDGKSRERRLINKAFSDLGFDPKSLNILFELDSIESVKSMVINGYGLSLLPYSSIKKELYTKQLKEVRVQDFIMECDIYMIYKRDEYMKKCIREFINYIVKIGDKSFC